MHYGAQIEATWAALIKFKRYFDDASGWPKKDLQNHDDQFPMFVCFLRETLNPFIMLL